MMKSIQFLFTSLIAVFFFSSHTTAQTSDAMKLKVDTEKSSIQWTGYKVTGKHFGVIDIKDGYVLFDESNLVGGEFTIDMTTIRAKDISGQKAEKLEGHLKSDDFFGVADHPTSSLALTTVESGETSGEYTLGGDLTIKGMKEPITFEAKMTDMGSYLEATTSLEIDRTKYDVRYGSGKFFDNLGDRAISDNFDLEITLVIPKL